MFDIASGPIEPVNVRHRVRELIRDAILVGKLQPGERVVELRLAKQLGVGTTSIREALFELEKQGFVSRVTNKGVFVTQLGPADIQQIYRVRMELEGLAVELAKENAAPTDLLALDKPLEEMKKAALAADLPLFYHNDLEFHQRLWQLSRNQYVIRFLESMVVPLFAFFTMRVQRDSSEELLSIWECHEKILRALRFASPSEARKTLGDSLTFFWNLDKHLLFAAEGEKGRDGLRGASAPVGE